MTIGLESAILGSAGIGAASSLFSGWQSGRDTKAANRQNYKYALEMAERERQYNHPAEQYKRYQEAGLNPAVMMAGHGNSGNVNYSTPHAERSEKAQHYAEAIRRSYDALSIKDLENRVDISGIQRHIAAHDLRIVDQHPNIPSDMILNNRALHASAFGKGVSAETSKILDGLGMSDSMIGRLFWPNAEQSKVHWSKR